MTSIQTVDSNFFLLGMSIAMEAHLKERVEAALDVDNFRNAIFLAERLHACRQTPENAMLLARCYIRNRQDFRAIPVLKKLASRLPPRGMLMLSQALYRTNVLVETERMTDQALEMNISEANIKAELHYLRGMVYRKTARLMQARMELQSALGWDRFHWSALEELCKFGKHEEIKNQLERIECDSKTPEEIEERVPIDDSEMVVDSQEGPGWQVNRPIPFRREASPQTPQSLIRPVFYRTTNVNAGNIRPNRLMDTTPRQRSLDPRSPETPAGKIQRVDAPAGSIAGKNDERPSSDSHYYSAEEDLTDSSTSALRPASHQPPTENPYPWQTGDGMSQCRRLMGLLSRALYALNTFDYEKARDLLGVSLPACQRNTAWVKSKLGCLYIQTVNYECAKTSFLQARELDPTALEDMDAFSSLLYLMGDATELSNMETTFRQMDSLAPETWCVAGNFYSLLKEHQRALDAFRRAIQLDEWHSYAYSLCGHTYLEMGQFDRANRYFTRAIERNPSQPNALFGRGLVQFHTQEYEKASKDFQQAVFINPYHSVFRLRYAVTLIELGKKEEDPSHHHNRALREFNTATRLDAMNKEAYLQKGKLEYQMIRYSEAKETFKRGLRIDHKDPELHYRLGLVHKRLGEKTDASCSLSTALDLVSDPVLRSNIRAALDQIDSPEEDQLRKY